MNLESKSLVSGLLNTVRKINSVKDDIEYIKSVRCSTIDKNLLGEHIVSIASFYPEFIEDFKDFLDKEIENIDIKLKEL